MLMMMRTSFNNFIYTCIDFNWDKTILIFIKGVASCCLNRDIT